MNEEKKMQIIAKLAQESNTKEQYVTQLIELVGEGNTVPFIARYRKEMTGGLDEVQIRDIVEKWEYENQLLKRQEEVVRLIEEQGKLTNELRVQIESAKKLQEIEDLYRPYKQKRRTRATVAKEKGLEPFAEWLFSLPKSGDIESESKAYINEEKEVTTIEEVIQGAQDIIAEWVSDDADLRKRIRHRGFSEGKIQTSVKDQSLDEKSVFEMYYEYDEAIRAIVPHRILAMNRGEKEGILRVSLLFPNERVLQEMKRKFITQHSIVENLVSDAIEDAYKRLITPSIEREIRNELTEKAEAQAIHIFSENLRHLLLQPPMKDKVVLGVDPAYRTGCKLLSLIIQGKCWI
ncbi:transcription accessory protein [Halalkalibacter hemicellulosilyticusJCM 9152]|uniref:Transcription accessory protein n=1 Tax=Halalkalibacter hemicellulosilyticusJCM 9152 TaxID=1236971 RepID=W4QA55_9BACI|nr:transcription accessory protein [Halalkalibacter hemicellulosilyticusJCM 9152]